MEDAVCARNVSILCPLCRESEVTTLYPEVQDYITQDVFSVLRCSKCDLSWTQPVPNDLNPYYPHTYRRYNIFVLSVLKFLYRRRVSRWNQLFDKPGSALELGCGDGFMLNALRSYGWRVFGTERTDSMAAFARKNFGLTVYVEDNAPIPTGEKYDLVIMFQVLEHLRDPILQLTRAVSLLGPNGKLIICVPNRASWQAKLCKEQWFHLDVPRHLFHWSPDSLRVAAEIAGVKFDSSSFTSLEHDPYGWIQSILNCAFGDRNRMTLLLMRAKPFQLRDLVMLMLAVAITPCAFLVSLSSWVLGRGAIIQVVLTRDTGLASHPASEKSR